MTMIVTDAGFKRDEWTGEILDLAPAHDLEADPVPLDAPLIRIGFAGFTDGRGFTVARSLRLQGYRGRLRAEPGLIADQYTMARRSGFDEVEIAHGLARRQPEAQWLFRAGWRVHDLQSQLRG